MSAEILTPEDRLAIYQNLRGTVCVCTATKKARQSFCRRHYFQLPPGTRQSLYVVDEYPETFTRACGILNLPMPEPTQQRKDTR